jgi:AcrR family transcriptional regulator
MDKSRPVDGTKDARAGGRPRKPTGERILQAALRLFARRGFEGTGIRDIAAAAGVTTATLYHYASTKEDLLLTIMRRGMDIHLGTAREIFVRLRSPEERLAALVQVHVVIHGTWQLSALVGDTEFRTLSGEHREMVGRMRDEYESFWREVLAEGASLGAFEIEDPKLSAFALLEMCTGVVHWYSAEGSLPITEIAESFTDMALSLVRATRDGEQLRAVDLNLPDVAGFLPALVPEDYRETA